MTRISETAFVRQQYRDGANLRARIALHRDFSTNPGDLRRWLWEQLELPEDARVLELGCGPGYLWQVNGERIPPGWQITLTDLSPGMVAEARANLASVAGRFMLGVVDAQQLPFDDACFDAVLAIHMLYHVPDRDRAYGEIRRVLRPDGRLYAVTNGENHMRELHELAPQAGIESRWGAGPDGPFRLETGGAELGRWFPSVELRRYDDGLLIDRVGPLVDYLLSTGPVADGDRPRAALEQHFASLIETGGPIAITKDTGLFIAGEHRSAKVREDSRR